MSLFAIFYLLFWKLIMKLKINILLFILGLTVTALSYSEDQNISDAYKCPHDIQCIDGTCKVSMGDPNFLNNAWSIKTTFKDTHDKSVVADGIISSGVYYFITATGPTSSEDVIAQCWYSNQKSSSPIGVVVSLPVVKNLVANINASDSKWDTSLPKELTLVDAICASVNRHECTFTQRNGFIIHAINLGSDYAIKTKVNDASFGHNVVNNSIIARNYSDIFSACKSKQCKVDFYLTSLNHTANDIKLGSVDVDMYEDMMKLGNIIQDNPNIATVTPSPDSAYVIDIKRAN